MPEQKKTDDYQNALQLLSSKATPSQSWNEPCILACKQTTTIPISLFIILKHISSTPLSVRRCEATT